MPNKPHEIAYQICPKILAKIFFFYAGNFTLEIYTWKYGDKKSSQISVLFQDFQEVSVVGGFVTTSNYNY